MPLALKTLVEFARASWVVDRHTAQRAKVGVL